MAHTSFLMRNIHCIHHRHKITVGLAATYSHPLEHLFVNVLSAASGPKILKTKMHNWTLLMHMAWMQMQTVHAHSGYNFPWVPFGILPFGTSSEYHDYHHSHSGNYAGPFLIWDYIFGTNKEYFKHLEIKYKKV